MEDITRRLAFHASLLLFVGLLTGGYVSSAMTGMIPVDPGMALAAHLNAVIGAVILGVVGWSLSYARTTPARASLMAWLLIGGNWANWLVTAIKAVPAVHGVGPTGDPANDAVFGVLTVTVVLPSLVGAGMWAASLRPGPLRRGPVE